MTVRFETIEQYYTQGAVLGLMSARLNGLLLTEMDEPSNEIRVASTRLHSVLRSISGSDNHTFSAADARHSGKTRSGDVALVPAGADLHSAWETRVYTLRTLAIEFDQSLFTAFVPELCTDRFLAGTIRPSGYGRNAALDAAGALLAREMHPETAMGPLFSDTVVRLLAMEVATACWSVPAQLPRPANRRDPRIDRALAFIEAHVLEEISLLDIARASGLSVSLLTARFQIEVGHTPYAYVIERRVCHAVRLLQGTDMPIAQVASESGFSDQQHLTRVIRARRCTTPKAIRLGTWK